MKRAIITIENGIVSVPSSGNIWMSEYEIATLFECFPAKIGSNIRSIFKSGVLNENSVCRTFRYGNGNSVDRYGLEMIAALSFRIQSHHAALFRAWMMRKITVHSAGRQCLPNIIWDTAYLN